MLERFPPCDTVLVILFISLFLRYLHFLYFFPLRVLQGELCPPKR